MRILKASIENSPETFSLIHFMQLVPFIPPESIRNPPVFCFQGVEKETSSMKKVKRRFWFPLRLEPCTFQLNNWINEEINTIY